MVNSPQKDGAGTVATQSGPFPYRLFAGEPDILPLVDLINACEAVDQVDRGSTEEEQRRWLTWPGFDPSRNLLLVDHPDQPGKLIAAAHISKEENDDACFGNVRVHPEWRHQGIGTMLLDALVERAQARGAVGLKINAEEKVPDGPRLLENSGFKMAQALLELRIEADEPLVEAELPAGYTVRSYAEASDFDALLDGYNRGFQDHWDNHPMTADELRGWLAWEALRPAGIFLAYGPAGDVAGECWAIIDAARNKRRGEPRGYIDTLAVAREHRRQGLGRALLVHGMRWLRSQGMGPLTLHVYGGNERALPLYTGVGMRLSKRSFEYRRDF